MLVNAYADTIHTCPVCRMVDYRSGQELPISYAHKHTARKHCDECEGDRIAMLGIALERQGIMLGWGVAEHSKEYERGAYQQHRAR